MNEQSAELPRAAPPDLKALIRRAKLEDAERSSVVAEMRGAEQARLELLRDALEPVFAQVPAHAELFDHGLVPGEKPRLFIDIVSFVEMARDRRCYRFIQDTRAGTLVLAESDRIEAMSRHVANYLARRLIEREKALSAPLPNFRRDEAGDGGEALTDEGRAETAASASLAAKRRRSDRWQLLVTLLLGALLGIALTHAYEVGALDNLLPSGW
ncbi:MAG: hypothetical protein JO188_14530 [Hyphomicrobiales bacterium]|nr:hypothetical protein [Hyphomicrobiales bacterium]